MGDGFFKGELKRYHKGRAKVKSKEQGKGGSAERQWKSAPECLVSMIFGPPKAGGLGI